MPETMHGGGHVSRSRTSRGDEVPPTVPVTVSKWGELPGERTLPGCVRVLVGGQSAGGAECVGTEWRATWFTAKYQDKFTIHPTAEEAVLAVIRSGWARRLGARKSSPVSWTTKARRIAGVSE